MRPRIVIQFLFIFLFFAICRLPLASADEPPDLEFIIAALEAQDSKIEDIYVHRVLLFNVHSFDISVADYQGSIGEVIYARKGETEYTRMTNRKTQEQTSWFDQEVSFKKGLLKVLGHSTSESRPNFGEIRNDYGRTFQRFVLPKGPRTPVWDKPLLKRLKEDEPTILPAQEEVDGHPCWVLEGGASIAPEQLRYKVYLDPEIGFLPRLYEEIGTATIRRHFKSYQEIQPGIWYPSRVGEEVWKGNRIDRRNLYVIDIVKINSGLPPETFEINFPPGTLVWDEIAGIKYTVGSPGNVEELLDLDISSESKSLEPPRIQESEPEEEKSRAEKTSEHRVPVEEPAVATAPAPWSLWPFLLIGICGLLLGAFILWRRCRAKTP